MRRSPADYQLVSRRADEVVAGAVLVWRGLYLPVMAATAAEGMPFRPGFRWVNFLLGPAIRGQISQGPPAVVVKADECVIVWELKRPPKSISEVTDAPEISSMPPNATQNVADGVAAGVAAP